MSSSWADRRPVSWPMVNWSERSGPSSRPPPRPGMTSRSGSSPRAPRGRPRRPSTCTTICSSAAKRSAGTCSRTCGPPARSRARAERFARLLRSVRPARARDRAGGPHVLGRQAVLRLRPGQCAVLPVSRGRLDGPLPGPLRAGEGVRGHHARAPYVVLRGPHGVCRDAAGAGRRTAVRPPVGPGLQLGGRAAPQGDLRALARAVRARDPRRDRLDRDVPHLHREPPRPRAPGSSGTVVPGYEAKLIDDSGREVAVGEVGNLMVKGDSACSCYWNQHERTKQTIEGEWVRTGDKYTRDADGYFWYAGRTDDMIKAGGMWVSPAEVE